MTGRQRGRRGSATYMRAISVAFSGGSSGPGGEQSRVATGGEPVDDQPPGSDGNAEHLPWRSVRLVCRQHGRLDSTAGRRSIGRVRPAVPVSLLRRAGVAPVGLDAVPGDLLLSWSRRVPSLAVTTSRCVHASCEAAHPCDLPACLAACGGPGERGAGFVGECAQVAQLLGCGGLEGCVAHGSLRWSWVSTTSPRAGRAGRVKARPVRDRRRRPQAGLYATRPGCFAHRLLTHDLRRLRGRVSRRSRPGFGRVADRARAAPQA